MPTNHFAEMQKAISQKNIGNAVDSFYALTTDEESAWCILEQFLLTEQIGSINKFYTEIKKRYLSQTVKHQMLLALISQKILMVSAHMEIYMRHFKCLLDVNQIAEAFTYLSDCLCEDNTRGIKFPSVTHDTSNFFVTNDVSQWKSTDDFTTFCRTSQNTQSSNIFELSFSASRSIKIYYDRHQDGSYQWYGFNEIDNFLSYNYSSLYKALTFFI